MIENTATIKLYTFKKILNTSNLTRQEKKKVNKNIINKD